MTFGENAARLAGVAGALLGWRPEEFWRATPGEFAAVVAALAGVGAGQGGERPALADDLARLMEAFPDG
ncbi:phage tail assembly chaperone [Sphingomonas naphthae]|uniref:Phage tail assembly chaperone n=1 Tax=Sphingomonas naphthae TaxID=1813468 RepID=A0ABY7TKW9_9SPHN|nr:phage tail assembly chaperone [Sphingomonas naphthae]WCT73678.1 phage tail assembly chaperone [Sphingomonas naphthae]